MNIIETQVYGIFSLLLFCLLFIRFIDGTNWEKFARADYRVGNTKRRAARFSRFVSPWRGILGPRFTFL